MKKSMIPIKSSPSLRFTFLILFLLSMFSFCGKKDVMDNLDSESLQLETSIPVQGNSWIVNNPDENISITHDAGLTSWSDPASRIRTFFYIENTGDLNLGIRAKVNSGQSKLKFTFCDVSKELAIQNTHFENIPIGTFVISRPGYQWLEMQGIDKSSTTFLEVTDILIGGGVSQGKVYYVKDDFYWGRRGPSVHLSYEPPEDAGDVLWFYNEITIPEGNDVLGSYFMANGFAEGYFGIQVNSQTERRILFSVWSPYQTDNPNEIPEDHKIILLNKGDGVYTGEFGNEGSGGQSYRKYFWKSGTTYQFLLKGEPSENNSTDFTSYFYAPEIGEWELIASFRRPKTNTYLKRLHSFLENFLTETGHLSRTGIYSNQWIYDTRGNWHELTKAKFTADATARKEARLDYSGGAENEIFFLKNCGFFNDRSTIGSMYTRDMSGQTPDINFSRLPGQQSKVE